MAGYSRVNTVMIELIPAKSTRRLVKYAARTNEVPAFAGMTMDLIWNDSEFN